MKIIVNNIMKTEFEATFIDINTNDIRHRLQEIGAELVRPETLMRRVNFFPPQDDTSGWMRIRDEGDKITLSYKRYLGWEKKTKDTINNQQEIFLIINELLHE